MSSDGWLTLFLRAPPVIPPSHSFFLPTHPPTPTLGILGPFFCLGGVWISKINCLTAPLLPLFFLVFPPCHCRLNFSYLSGVFSFLVIHFVLGNLSFLFFYLFFLTDVHNHPPLFWGDEFFPQCTDFPFVRRILSSFPSTPLLPSFHPPSSVFSSSDAWDEEANSLVHVLRLRFRPFHRPSLLILFFSSCNTPLSSVVI